MFIQHCVPLHMFPQSLNRKSKKNTKKEKKTATKKWGNRRPLELFPQVAGHPAHSARKHFKNVIGKAWINWTRDKETKVQSDKTRFWLWAWIVTWMVPMVTWCDRKQALKWNSMMNMTITVQHITAATANLNPTPSSDFYCCHSITYHWSVALAHELMGQLWKERKSKYGVRTNGSCVVICQITRLLFIIVLFLQKT